MRVLLMISNSNVAVRELYGLVLRERYPTWGVSQMSGLPANPGPIVQAYEALVYEMGAANDPKRYKAVQALWDELKESGKTRLITHIEGPFREGVVAELESQGVVCVEAPFTPDNVAAAFARVAPAPRQQRKDRQGSPAQDKAEGGRGLLRGLFRRRE
jgi:hypothetical protein